ncbi:MAG: SpoIIE family protein phosphatase [Kouleothrix sp.]|nr:SpoIIE family protein phosphatase [Kouleothrix sp.]
MTLNEPIIAQVPLFATLPIEELARLTAQLREIIFSHGTVLFHEGDLGDRFYIVIEGELEIIKALGTSSEFVLDARGPGEFVGEMSLLNRDGLRSASVRARGRTRTLEVTRDDFEALLQHYPSLAYEMVHVLSNRLRDANNATIRDLQAKNQQLTAAYLELQAAQAQIIEKETIERELQVARGIQENMLPRSLPQLAGFDFSAHMLPARVVSGDFYDFIPLDEARLGVVIADVCGKSVPAALLMALTRSLLRAEASRDGPPVEVLRSVNRHLLDMNDSRTFVTMIYGILHRPTREFVYVRAGHELPLVVGPDGAVEVPDMGNGQPLGILPEPKLSEQSVTIPRGGALLLYTDGITEAIDPRGRFFETERLYAVAQAYRGAAARTLSDQVLQAVAAHQGAAAQADDVTLVAVHALP